MKKIVVTLLLCIASNYVIAQNISDYVIKLSIAEPSNGAKATVQADSKSNTALQNIRPLSLTEDKVQGFRVCVFFDNSQSARGAANTAMTQLQSLYPTESHYLVYTNPVFKVLVGDCLTRAEATRLMGQLRTNFPRAFIVNEQIPLKNFASHTEKATTTTNDTILD